MNILVLNCGSSSVKYQVIEVENGREERLAKGLVDRIGLPDGDAKDHKEGIEKIIGSLTTTIDAVGHRVAHGGSYFEDSALVTPEVIEKIRSCFELAPLHNPANLQGILSVAEILPDVPQVAVFDTAFHQTIPAHNYMYALPWEYYERLGVRKFGFHGTSHKFVADKGADMAGIVLGNSRIITCHIGNGASVTAVVNGKSFDTSMGFTPVDGLMMGTRTGSIDPGALLFIGEKEGLNYDQLGAMINKSSGVMGVTGISSDMRDIVAASESGNERATLALKMYDSRVKHFIGAYAAEMGGVDLIIFTGGVGENQWQSRANICSGLEFMGVEFDMEANDGLRGEDKIISTDSSRVKVAVVTTNEELVIARDTYRLTR